MKLRHVETYMCVAVRPVVERLITGSHRSTSVETELARLLRESPYRAVLVVLECFSADFDRLPLSTVWHLTTRNQAPRCSGIWSITSRLPRA